MIDNKPSLAQADSGITLPREATLDKSVIIHTGGGEEESALSGKFVKEIRANDSKRRNLGMIVAFVCMALGFVLFVLEILFSGTSSMTVDKVSVFGVKVGHFTGGVGIGMLVAGALLLVSVNNYTLNINNESHAHAGFARRKKSAADVERVG